MTQIEKILILKVAKAVRTKLQKKYIKLWERDIYVGIFLKNSLAGFCYEASETLQKELLKHNISTALIQGHVEQGGAHYWLEYKKNIIDLTACQFNRYTRNKFPLILIKPISRLRSFIVEDIV